jgi:hypothetical protein
MMSDRPGAHSFVRRYTPYTPVHTSKAHRYTPARTYRGASIDFGNQVDSYLTGFVDQGWLDLSYACDPEFENLVAHGHKAATAAHDIRNELIRAGFVATESQVAVSAFGFCPILDLLGYNRVGEYVIVEIKGGRSALDVSTGSGSMRPPFDTIKNNGRNKAMMQLALQRSCLSQSRGIDITTLHSWLVTQATSKRTQCICIMKLPIAIAENVHTAIQVPLSYDSPATQDQPT